MIMLANPSLVEAVLRHVSLVLSLVARALGGGGVIAQ
jgi:hypothetical protein